MFRFESVGYLFYLWLIPIFGIAAVMVNKWNERKLKKALGDRAFPFLTSSLSPSRVKLKLILELCVLALGIVAWARPQQGEGRQKIKSRGIEVIVALDVSNSMLAEDHKPSRLEHAK